MIHTTRLSLLMSRNIPEDHARELIAAYELDPTSQASAIPRHVFSRFGDPEWLRDRIDRAVGSVLWNVSNYPERAQARLLGHDFGPLRIKVTDAVLAALEESDKPQEVG